MLPPCGRLTNWPVAAASQRRATETGDGGGGGGGGRTEVIRQAGAAIEMRFRTTIALPLTLLVLISALGEYLPGPLWLL